MKDIKQSNIRTLLTDMLAALDADDSENYWRAFMEMMQLHQELIDETAVQNRTVTLNTNHEEMLRLEALEWLFHKKHPECKTAGEFVAKMKKTYGQEAVEQFKSTFNIQEPK